MYVCVTFRNSTVRRPIKDYSQSSVCLSVWRLCVPYLPLTRERKALESHKLRTLSVWHVNRGKFGASAQGHIWLTYQCPSDFVASAMKWRRKLKFVIQIVTVDRISGSNGQRSRTSGLIKPRQEMRHQRKDCRTVFKLGSGVEAANFPRLCTVERSTVKVRLWYSHICAEKGR